jgi:predicted phosphoribosyltransferase
MVFQDRYDAGQRLATALQHYQAGRPVVLGLPRGGVVVGFEIARALGAPLDVLIVRKLGAPGAEEYAIGAVAPGATLLNRQLVARLGVPAEYLRWIIARETEEMLRRERIYRGNRPAVTVQNRPVILVDDGLATGATAQAAVESLRRRHPSRIIFAAPVCSVEGARALESVADEVVCLECPADFRAVGLWYRDFSQTTDAEVIECLRQSNTGRVA